MIAILLALAGAALADVGRDPPSSITLTSLEARLFYAETGRLSENILDRTPEFIGHNTIIGEGDAEENANDILVSVVMLADKFGDNPEKFVEAPVVIEVRDRLGKVVGSRRWSSVLTSTKGRAVKALWLNDVTCSGPLTITASYNGAKLQSRIMMGCGE